MWVYLEPNMHPSERKMYHTLIEVDNLVESNILTKCSLKNVCPPNPNLRQAKNIQHNVILIIK